MDLEDEGRALHFFEVGLNGNEMFRVFQEEGFQTG